jgi:hypothetical protein
VGLWQLRGDRELKLLLPSITLAALVVSTGLLGWTAARGGEIRHEEIRPGAATPGAAVPDADRTVPPGGEDAERPGDDDTD